MKNEISKPEHVEELRTALLKLTYNSQFKNVNQWEKSRNWTQFRD